MEVENDVADFSHEKTAVSVHDLVNWIPNLDAWKAELRATSDLFRRDPCLEVSSALLIFAC